MAKSLISFWVCPKIKEEKFKIGSLSWDKDKN